MTIDDGGPAFPSQGEYKDDWGMTLRQWYAGKILCALLSNPYLNSTPNLLIQKSFNLADAMIVESKKED